MAGQSAAGSPLAGGSGSAIRAGVLLPPRDVLPAVAAATAAALSAWAEERNAAGGVGGRRLELAFAAPEGSPEERASAASAFLQEQEPLALVASFTDGADAELAEVAGRAGVPLLATLSSSPRSSIAASPFLRDLCGGVVEQGAALMRTITPELGGGAVAIVHGDDATGVALVGQAIRAGLRSVLVSAEAASADEMRDDGAAAVLFAGAHPQMLRIADEMRELAWWPPLLLAGAALPPRALDGGRPTGGIWLAVPTTDRDRSPEAVESYLRLAEKHRVPAAHPISQFAALTSLQLFVEAVERVEGTVNRASLLAAVDRTSAMRTGLFPPLTYRPGRTIGSTGTWIIAVHRGRNAAPLWVDLGG